MGQVGDENIFNMMNNFLFQLRKVGLWFFYGYENILEVVWKYTFNFLPEKGLLNVISRNKHIDVLKSLIIDIVLNDRHLLFENCFSQKLLLILQVC